MVLMGLAPSIRDDGLCKMTGFAPDVFVEAFHESLSHTHELQRGRCSTLGSLVRVAATFSIALRIDEDKGEPIGLGSICCGAVSAWCWAGLIDNGRCWGTSASGCLNTRSACPNTKAHVAKDCTPANIAVATSSKIARTSAPGAQLRPSKRVSSIHLSHQKP